MRREEDSEVGDEERGNYERAGFWLIWAFHPSK